LCNSRGIFPVIFLVNFLAIFLVTRKEVLPDTRYQSSVQVLIPARDSKGNRPAGIPPSLLQGQVQLAQTALDPRNDPDKVSRSLALTGIFNCVSCYKCEEVCPAAIPIVSRIIEPLKAKAALLVPAMAKHSFALRDIVAARGRVDPGALILRVQGLRALANMPRIVRLLLRRKINPLKTLFRIKTAAAEAAGRIMGRGIT